MAFACTDSMDTDLHVFLTRVLDAYKGGEISQNRAIIVMTHVIQAAIADDTVEFGTCIRLPLAHYHLDHPARGT